MSLKAIQSILLSHSEITTSVYMQILKAIPSGLVGKLRLVPDSTLSSKLAHLLTVSRIETGEEDLGFDYNCLSVEGINTDVFLMDHDAIVIDLTNEKVIIIDCTSNPDLLMAKQRVLESQVNESELLDAGRVHVFNAKRFKISITRPAELYSTSSNVFDLLEMISLKTEGWKDEFFNACTTVYETVCSNLLATERPELDERYLSTDVSTDKLRTAARLVQDHTGQDAEMLMDLAGTCDTSVYINTFSQILMQQRPLSAPCMNMPATLNTNNSLASVLNHLSANIIAESLSFAMRNEKKWIGTMGHNDHRLIVGPSVKKVLPETSPFLLCVRYVGAHLFDIKFSLHVVDQNFKEMICGNAKMKGSTRRFPFNICESFKEMNAEYAAYMKELMEAGLSTASNSFFGKLTTMANEYIRTSVEISKHACSMTSSVANFMNEITAGDILNHDYEVAKTFAASLKGGARIDRYYVGINGPFNSVTLTRLSSSQDSFNTAAYFVIYERASNRSFSCVRAIEKVEANIVQGRTRTFNKNSLAHALRLPSIIISLMTWELEHVTSRQSSVTKKTLLQIAINSVLHASVNNDQFAQCAEQIRYLFTSNVGFGANPVSICSKIDFIRTNTLWELLYLFRMLKLAAGLNVTFKGKNIGSIIEGREFSVMFPNNVSRTTSFSHLVSSMYYANIYNKFRAFHEVSEAICYNELDAENEIYMKSVMKNSSFVNGISPTSIAMLQDVNMPNFPEIIEQEVSFCESLIATGPERFKFSLFFVVGATLSHTSVSDAEITKIYKILNTSPIEACTMKGATESGPAKLAHQGIRAASAMLEELIDEFEFDRDVVNKNRIEGAYFLHKISESDFDFSIIAAVARQFKFKENYRYRVVQKDQKGHREISVLNAKFRLGALLCEKVAHAMSDQMPCDVLDNPAKDVLVENIVRSTMRDTSNKFIISDNSDQKRWGPNHLLHSFSAMYLALFRKDAGLFRLLNLVLHYGECKMAKFPETLVDLGIKVNFVSNSEPIMKFFEAHRSDVQSNRFEKQFSWGMCQGIFHRTSSLYHGIMCSVVSDVCKKMETIPEHTLHSFVTSDDAERIFAVKDISINRITICKRLHSLIQNVGSVMNILRNESKSVFSSHITEFNSIFYHNGFLATPTLKQRISKIDIGDGHDPILDYLTATSLAMGYFQNGGSYAGTVNLMLLNVTMHTEQWRRWRIIQDGLFDRPVEFGGFPVIEPFTTMYCGPISSLYLRSKMYIDAAAFSYMITKSTILPAQEVKLSDFQRVRKAVDPSTDVKVFKSAGPMGIISLSRTDRRLSQFEKRHHMSKWFATDKFVTLRSDDPYAGKFIFSLMKITKTCIYEFASGVNSFYLRFTDPWVNNDRKCLRFHTNSLFIQEIFQPGIQDMATINEYTSRILSITENEMHEFYNKIRIMEMRDTEISRLTFRLKTLMIDADAICSTLYDLVDIQMVEAVNKNSIVKLNLSVATPLDEDEFHLSLLKSTIGPRIKSAMIKKTGNPAVWDRVQTLEGFEQMEPLEGIFHCANIIELYNRFVRRSTKMICPGDTKPISISELMEKVLSHKYTETFGIKTVKFPELLTTRLPAMMYRAHNHDMMNKSQEYWIDKENNIDVNRSYMPMQVGIDSDKEMITAHDTFNITGIDATEKVVEIRARGKFTFIHRIRMWLAAKVLIQFTENTKDSFLRNEFTHYHEYCVHDDLYVKNQTGLAMKVLFRKETCLDLQYCSSIEGGNVYYHHFLVDTNAMFVTVSAEQGSSQTARGWAHNVIQFINSRRRFRTNTEIAVPNGTRNVTDYIMFVNINTTDKYRIETFPNNLTVFIRHLKSDLLIPVCSQQISELKDINLGIHYSPADYISAMTVFKEMFDDLHNIAAMPEPMKAYLKLLLFRTSYTTSVDVLNDFASKKELPYALPNKESADILRSFVICSVSRDLKGERVRIQHYFLNLFRSSAHYNNGLTSMSFRELILNDAEGILDMDEETMEEIVDMSIPDAPMWHEHEQAPVADPNIRVDITDTSLFGTELPFSLEELFPTETDPETDLINSIFGMSALPPEPAMVVDTGIEIRDSHVINRHFEECTNIIRTMKSMAASLTAREKPMGVYMDPANFVQTIQALCTSTGYRPERTVDALNIMYGGNCPLFNMKFPLSALCITELNF